MIVLAIQKRRFAHLTLDFFCRSSSPTYFQGLILCVGLLRRLLNYFTTVLPLEHTKPITHPLIERLQYN